MPLTPTYLLKLQAPTQRCEAFILSTQPRKWPEPEPQLLLPAGMVGPSSWCYLLTEDQQLLGETQKHSSEGGTDPQSPVTLGIPVKSYVERGQPGIQSPVTWKKTNRLESGLEVR